MKIDFHRQFKKHYQKRIRPHPTLVKKFEARVKLWIENSRNPVLKDHKLSGDIAKYRAFWITGDVRITYKMISEGIVEFYDIGSHNQVY
jgi:addiction module RelE/StbE family toxin